MTLKRFVFIFLYSLSLANLFAQGYDKKAVKLTIKAEEAVKERDFGHAKELLKKAIHSDSSYGKAYLRLAKFYNLLGQPDSAARYYNLMVKKLPAEEIGEPLWQRIAGINFEQAHYQLAKEAISHVANPDELLFASITFSQKSVEQHVEMDLEELPKAINAYQMQYFPVLTIDEQTIIYTKRNSNAPTSDEDMVVSTKIGGQWIPSQSISQEINTPYNEGACSISADGRTLIFTSCEGRNSFGSCDLYISYKEGNHWSRPKNLGADVNSRYWDSQPALSADGRTLYFASNRPGGNGSRDIWVTKRVGNGWSQPENLGKTINTKFDETTPFIHANSTSLFFSSKGHPGLGGFDLFLSEKKENEWKSPRNLGYPINTSQDEISLFINASGTTGYFAIDNTSGSKMSKIVQFQVPFDSLLVDHSSYVVGTIKNSETGNPLGCTLRMTNLNDSSDFYVTSSDSISGKYFLALTEGKEYGVFISRENYLFEDLTFRTQGNSLVRPDTVDILLKPIKKGESVILENVYFEFGEYHLSSKSKSELDQLALFIKGHSSLHFEIQGHTDNVGDSDYNLNLSVERAKSVYEYLLHKGVQKTHFFYKGYGDAYPVMKNDSDLGRQKNRRISFEVLSEN